MKNENKRIKIGELAKMIGCSVETIRYYEDEHLISRPIRGKNNYRIYTAADFERLQFIRNCRALGMTLNEIRLITRLELQASNCSEINALLDKHIQDISLKINQLKGLTKQLTILKQQCHAPEPLANCGILKELHESKNKNKNNKTYLEKN